MASAATRSTCALLSFDKTPCTQLACGSLRTEIMCKAAWRRLGSLSCRAELIASSKPGALSRQRSHSVSNRICAIDRPSKTVAPERDLKTDQKLAPTFWPLLAEPTIVHRSAVSPSPQARIGPVDFHEDHRSMSPFDFEAIDAPQCLFLIHPGAWGNTSRTILRYRRRPGYHLHLRSRRSDGNRSDLPKRMSISCVHEGSPSGRNACN